MSQIKALMASRLNTRERVEHAADAIGVSVATLYRYKTAPETIPLGKVMALNDILGYSLGDGATWNRREFIEAEARRAELEELIANGGTRVSVTPAFSVNAQLPEVTRAVMDFDHGVHRRSDFDEYAELRQHRRELYLASNYESFEVINARVYEDFFAGRGRYRSIGRDLRDRQIEELLRTSDLEHVNRRIYTRATPELPIISWYSSGIVVSRIDDLVIEFVNRDAVDELAMIVDRFWKSTDIQSPDEVQSFLSDPQSVAQHHHGGEDHGSP